MPRHIDIPLEEIEVRPIRAQGAGGQNVNKVSNAVHLRFDVRASSLPPLVQERLCRLDDQRISKDGVVVIKAQEYRSLEKNRAEALRRLRELVARAATPVALRRPTRPTQAAVRRRLEGKAHRAQRKRERAGGGDAA